MPVTTAVHSRTLMAPRAPSTARAPTVPRVLAASLAMTDLRAQLERHHLGEDDHINIERHQERRRNLDGDFDVVTTTPVRQAAHTNTSLRSGVGCMALAPHLHMVVWLRKFRPHLPEKYDRNVNPTEFLQIYTISILIVGGNESVMANYFPMALTGTVRSWLRNLPQESLTSWEELYH
jgi:hypothetical protein